MTWQLRRADDRDRSGIMSLETSTFTTDAWSNELMRAELANPNCWYVVAFRPESPEQLDGYAGVLAPQGAREADIQTIAVRPEERGSGLGRTLMLTLVNEATKRGARKVFLEVRADNPGAQALYRSLGFEQVGVRPRYYQPDGVDAIVMRLIPTPGTIALASPTGANSPPNSAPRAPDAAQAPPAGLPATPTSHPKHGAPGEGNSGAEGA